MPVHRHKRPDRWRVQDVQTPDLHPLQEGLRQVPGDLLHVPHRRKARDEAAAAKPAQAVLDLQGYLVTVYRLISSFLINSLRYCINSSKNFLKSASSISFKRRPFSVPHSKILFSSICFFLISRLFRYLL